jgi:hypothetical protein
MESTQKKKSLLAVFEINASPRPEATKFSIGPVIIARVVVRRASRFLAMKKYYKKNSSK